jgi:peptide deformylase
MILPIVAYGDPVLRKVAEPISADYPNLSGLISDMFETMYAARGVGLAAPQIGKSIRLFIVDAAAFSEDEDEPDGKSKDPELIKLTGFKKVFINARIIEESGTAWNFSEGCLSIPLIREDVPRLPKINIQYLDENFREHHESFDGIAARIIQHEYDHIEGKLFVDRISPLRRKMIRGKMNDISKGMVSVDYRMKFPKN